MGGQGAQQQGFQNAFGGGPQPYRNNMGGGQGGWQGGGYGGGQQGGYGGGPGGGPGFANLQPGAWQTPPWQQQGGGQPPWMQPDYNPYMNMGKRFNTAEQEAAYWGQDVSQHNPQYDQWQAGRSAYEDRLVQDEQDLADRRMQWAEGLDIGEGMTESDKFHRMKWAQGQPVEEGHDFGEAFGSSDYGMSELDKFRSGRTDSWNEMQELQNRYRDLSNSFGNQYWYRRGGRVRRR